MIKIRYIVMIILITACGQLKKPTTFTSDCLPDSLFAATNLIELNPYHDIKFHDRFFYFNSKKLEELDSLQKVKWLIPFLGQNFSPTYWIAQFISKQDKVGNAQPIIIRVEGFQYISFWILLLDKNCNPINIYDLQTCEGQDGFKTDSTIMYCPIRKSRFNKNTIETIEIREIDFTKKGFKLIDSLSYSTLIDENGKFKTTRLDSIRLTRYISKNN